MGVEDSGWSVGAGVYVWEFGECPLFDVRLLRRCGKCGKCGY